MVRVTTHFGLWSRLFSFVAYHFGKEKWWWWRRLFFFWNTHATSWFSLLLLLLSSSSSSFGYYLILHKQTAGKLCEQKEEENERRRKKRRRKKRVQQWNQRRCSMVKKKIVAKLKCMVGGEVIMSGYTLCRLLAQVVCSPAPLLTRSFACLLIVVAKCVHVCVSFALFFSRIRLWANILSGSYVLAA